MRFQKNSRRKKLKLPKKLKEFLPKTQPIGGILPKISRKNINFISFRDQKLLRKSQIWENFLKNMISIQKWKIIVIKTIGNWQKPMKVKEFLKKLKEFLKKTQGILEKTQGTGGLRLAYPPKKCPNKKPGLLCLQSNLFPSY